MASVDEKGNRNLSRPAPDMYAVVDEPLWKDDFVSALTFSRPSGQPALSRKLTGDENTAVR